MVVISIRHSTFFVRGLRSAPVVSMRGMRPVSRRAHKTVEMQTMPYYRGDGALRSEKGPPTRTTALGKGSHRQDRAGADANPGSLPSANQFRFDLTEDQKRFCDWVAQQTQPRVVSRRACRRSEFRSDRFATRRRRRHCRCPRSSSPGCCGRCGNGWMRSTPWWRRPSRIRRRRTSRSRCRPTTFGTTTAGPRRKGRASAGRAPYA